MTSHDRHYRNKVHGLRSAKLTLPKRLALVVGGLPLLDLVVVLVAGLLTYPWLGFDDSGEANRRAVSILTLALVVIPIVLFDHEFPGQTECRDRGSVLARLIQRLVIAQIAVLLIAYSCDWLGSANWKSIAAWELTSTALMVAWRSLLTDWMRAQLTVTPEVRRNALNGNIGLNLALQGKPPRVGYVCDWLPVTVLVERPIQRWNAVAKAGKDYVLGVAITIALSPILLLIAIAIRLDSPGPILFRQRRHGVDNTDFEIYKFRTMRHGAVPSALGMDQTLRDDVRITRLGRWLRRLSLDELPQVFNVLNGQMSLVGPRPHAIDMRTERLLGPEIVSSYSHRHRVKPGITGLSQVNGLRGATDTQDQLRRRIEMDIHYIDHWSIWLDLKILLLTVRTVLRGTNAF